MANANPIVVPHFVGNQTTTFGIKFERERGLDLVRELIEGAFGSNVTGWRYSVLTSVRTSHSTPRVRVKGVDKHGLHVWLKPGDNATGVKGILHAPPNMNAEAAYKPLLDEATRRYGTAAMPEAQGTVVDDETTELFLMAVDDAAKLHHDSLDDFYESLVEQFPLDTDADGLRDVSAALQTSGLVQQFKNFCTVSPVGRTWLADRAEMAAAQVIDPTIGGDPLSVLLRSQERLKRLLGLPEKIFAARKKVTDLEKEIEHLMEKQDVAKAEERNLMAEIDPDILKFLMTPEAK